jgi:5-methylcytosine-specific restriction endonuclease McrA
MPLINSAVTFSPEIILKIATVKSESKLSHTRWGDDDLEELRREIRNFYRREQKLTCAYCREEIGSIAAVNAPIEHILPKSKYVQFMFEPKNLCVICADCNTYKRDREGLLEPPLYRNSIITYPLDSDRYRLFHPHIDEYNQHITKIKYIYLPGSKKGSYTIYACNLNRVIEELGVSDELFNDFATALERDRFGDNG